MLPKNSQDANATPIPEAEKKKFSLTDGETIVIKNPKAILSFGKTNVPHYEASERTFRVEEGVKNFRFFELGRKGVEKKRPFSVKKGDNVMDAFRSLLEFKSETEKTTIQTQDNKTYGKTTFVKHSSTSISNVIRKKRMNTTAQVICVVGIYDRKVRKSFRYVGFSNKVILSDLNSAHAMEEHQQTAMYSALGSYARHKKIGKFSYKSNRFIMSIEDTKIIYRRKTQFTRAYGSKEYPAEKVKKSNEIPSWQRI